MAFILPADLVKQQRQVLELFEALKESEQFIVDETLERSVVDFLLLTVEHIARHMENYKPEDWQAFLIDFAHEFTYQDEEGGMRNYLDFAKIDDLIFDCCSIDEDITPAEQLQELRTELLDLRFRFDDLQL